ncbi:hypothetical protein [Brevundimonas sp.]|uniref:hypothetical protein n=1 Tax=Brevundimonas sp. TaxID=1871086 RepID=UPI00289E74AA|nr:hypothetical protein [Brevundimonas sp.]
MDCSASALKLHQIDDPEAAADVIDEMLAKALTQRPSSAEECVALLDLVISSLERDQQLRADQADLQGLYSVRVFLTEIR